MRQGREKFNVKNLALDLHRVLYYFYYDMKRTRIQADLDELELIIQDWIGENIKKDTA